MRTAQRMAAVSDVRMSEDMVRRALPNKEFLPFYQPKVCIDTHELVGVEVLARWKHPTLGLISPAQFLPVMERLGLLDELFSQLLDQALRQRLALLALDVEINLAFNVHPVQLQNADFTQCIQKSLSRQGCPARAITIELLETGLITPDGQCFKNLLQLRLMGCGLSMDDFGSGFSSLQRLCELPFSEIKLDASFLRQINSNHKTRTIIANTINLAKAMGIKLVIEGVEELDQVRQLKEMGCSVAQGFFFARPMSAEQFVRYCLCGQ
jgi:EAL domain-containing protein (putative c-di-GMP-specific phosphodiesterase class I)